MKTFDRYILIKYLHVYVILFVTLFGLFVVFDGFTNVDGFQQDTSGPGEVLAKMATYYSYQSSFFFDLAGSILAAISIVIVFALLQRNGEIHPILAAGIPTFRLLMPVVVGIMVINAGLIVNQEYIIPRIAPALQASRNGLDKGTDKVDPVYDNSTLILITGEKLSLGKRKILEAKFVLPMGEIAQDLTTIEAAEASYLPASGERPGGWLLSGPRPQLEEIHLADKGEHYVRQLPDFPQTLFIVTDVDFDQLYNRSQSYKLASTPELIRRMKNPAFGITTIRGQMMHFHYRMVRPLINLLMVLVAVPLVVRKESRGLVTNMAVCTAVMAVVLGIIHASTYLGQTNLVTPHLAAWIPVIFSGTLGAWLTGVTQT
ncbi:MAG: LptF/LptG family permease [Planctomycetaceae bacterium]